MNTGFEIWDGNTHNVLQFDQLDEAIAALRDLVRSGGDDAITGLSLDAVSPDGRQRITLAEEAGLLDLVSATTASPR